MGWPAVVWWIVSMILTVLLTPKPTVENADAANPNDVNFPTASSVTTIPVVWGRVRLRTPNVVWYGDFGTMPIEVTQSSDGFFGIGASSTTQTIGYKYYWGQQLVLCHGIITLHRIWAEEREVWAGVITHGQATKSDLNFYGGEARGGGIEGGFNFYPGDQTQVEDPYLVSQLGPVPAYRGVAYLVWIGPNGPGVRMLVTGTRWVAVPGGCGFTRQDYTYWATRRSGYIGNSPQPKPISVEVSRYPHNLTGTRHMIGDDANPAEIIYELLTTDSMGPDGFGMGLPPTMIDISAFNAASVQLYNEGFGLSMICNQPSAIEDVIGYICKIIDAVCFRDFRTGSYTLKLIRGGYDPLTLPVLDETNILEVNDFSQASLEGTTNEIVLTYCNRARNFSKSVAQAQDLANMRLQGDVNSQALTYLAISNAYLADRVANRELTVASAALAGAEVIVNREAYAYGPGDLVIFNWPDLGISNMVMRVAKSAIGMPAANKIRLTLIQDVFALNATEYTSPIDTNWTDPIPDPVPVVNEKLVELPYFLNTDQSVGKIMVVAQKPNNGCVTYEFWMRTFGTSENYSSSGSCQSYTPSSTLIDAYGITDTIDETGALHLATAIDMVDLKAFTEDLMRQGAGLFYFATTGEWCSYRSVEGQLDGSLRFYGIWRGLFDTVQVAHSAGERIYFVCGGAMAPGVGLSQTATMEARLCPAGPRGMVDIGSATTIYVTMTGKNTKPLPPGRIIVNAHIHPITTVSSIDVTWGHRNRLTAARVVCRQDDVGEASAEGTYEWKLLVNGAIQETASGLTGTTWSRGGPYTPAQRIQDSANGNYLVEIQIRQTTGAGSSLWNSSGAFQMTGFGMCFGQYFGGVE